MKFISVLFSSVFILLTNIGFAFVSSSIDISNKEALQRGAKLYMNYCAGCHSLHYLRYNRMAKDIGITRRDGHVDESLLITNLIFTKAGPNSPIEVNMPVEDAINWFGIMPPDLSLVARLRGSAWIYTFLTSFYEDKSKPYGTNNLLLPGLSMPDTLAPLAGIFKLELTSKVSANRSNVKLVRVERGEMSEQEFNNALQDLITFLVYVSAPEKLESELIGIAVMVFLAFFALIVYLLKQSVNTYPRNF